LANAYRVMQKIIPLFLLFLSVGIYSYGQKIPGKLSLQQGDTLAITVEVKQTVAQQAMGQAIDFNVNGLADHYYKVTNSTADNSTLHHKVQRLRFDFDGMGQKRAFDSENKKDIEGQFGKPVKDMLGKEFDLIIDPAGKTLVVRPEKITLEKPDERLAIITNMLKDLISVVYPPEKGSASFFKVLPEEGAAVGESWQETFKTENESGITTYKLSAVTDSTIIVDFKTVSSSSAKAEMMGMETSTTMKSNATGKITLDKATGIIREKTTTIEANGATEVMGNSMPINSKTTISILVTRISGDR
jgi:hypothetical protein